MTQPVVAKGHLEQQIHSSDSQWQWCLGYSPVDHYYSLLHRRRDCHPMANKATRSWSSCQWALRKQHCRTRFLAKKPAWGHIHRFLVQQTKVSSMAFSKCWKSCVIIIIHQSEEFGHLWIVHQSKSDHLWSRCYLSRNVWGRRGCIQSFFLLQVSPSMPKISVPAPHFPQINLSQSPLCSMNQAGINLCARIHGSDVVRRKALAYSQI